MSWTPGQADYINTLQRCLKTLGDQSETLDRVAQKIFDSFQGDGVLHVFGSGHSHSLASELFHRAGGLAAVNPIFDTSTMPHRGPRMVGPTERLKGYAEVIFNANDIRKGEVVFVVSNSGINALPVEFAQKCKEVGAITVAFTSVEHSKNVPARAGKKLYEICDHVVDTGVPKGDACVSVEGTPVKVAPISTVVTTLAAELLVVRICELYSKAGLVAPVYQSANTPGGDEFNKALEERYSPRIPLLR